MRGAKKKAEHGASIKPCATAAPQPCWRRTAAQPQGAVTMAHGWVQSGARGLRPSRAGLLRVSPAVVGHTTHRSRLCASARARATTSLLPTAPSVSTLIRKMDGCHDGRGLVALGAVAVWYSSGTVHRRNTRDVQLRQTHSAFAPPLSAREAGLRQAHLAGRHPFDLAAWSRSPLSTSADTTPKKPLESTRDEGSDGVPVAEADVAEVVEPTTEEPRHAHIEMPSITDAERVATLTSWNVKVGDAIEVGDVVCEIELEHFSVGVKVETPGYLAEILVEGGTEGVAVGADIGTIVHAEEDIALYQQAQVPASEEKEVASESEETFSWKNVLKDVLRLRKEDKLSEDDASALMSLARNKDSELLQAFEGCFEGDDYKGEIDDDLFLAQALDIAKTRRKG